LLTASSGNVIKDIHSLMHQFTSVSVPTPLSLLSGLLKGKDSMDWLTIAKVWSEVGEVLESDVYGKIFHSRACACHVWLNYNH
jgi:hypothetical protein